VICDEELFSRRNLAFNPYDLTTSDTYPHATTDSVYAGNGQFVVRNAIDGITANNGHGVYPNQSWGPNQGNGHWMQVDFGREVLADEVSITIRADFPHDTHFESGTLEFLGKDGSTLGTVEILISKTDEPQSFSFSPTLCYAIKLKNLNAVDIAGNDWAAISEFEVFGSEANACKWSFDSQKRIVYGIAAGTTIESLKSGFSFDVSVLKDGNAINHGNAQSGMTLKLGGINYTVIVSSDLNGDGELNIIDLIRLKRLMAGNKSTKAELYAGDLDGDALLGAKDTAALVKLLLKK
jgi:hypothetical protein